MFHDKRPLVADEITDEAFALAATDLIGGPVLRLMGYDEQHREIDLAFGVVLGERVYDRDGDHDCDSWMDDAALRGGCADFWCHERLRDEAVAERRERIGADAVEDARAVAIATLSHLPIPREG